MYVCVCACINIYTILISNHDFLFFLFLFGYSIFLPPLVYLLSSFLDSLFFFICYCYAFFFSFFFMGHFAFDDTIRFQHWTQIKFAPQTMFSIYLFHSPLKCFFFFFFLSVSRTLSIFCLYSQLSTTMTTCVCVCVCVCVCNTSRHPTFSLYMESSPTLMLMVMIPHLSGRSDQTLWQNGRHFWPNSLCRMEQTH